MNETNPANVPTEMQTIYYQTNIRLKAKKSIL